MQMNRTGRGLEIAAMQNPERRLPRELKRIIADFVYYDWRNLWDVFPDTTETFILRGVTPTQSQRELWSLRGIPIRMNRDGHIIEIRLINRLLADHSIGDLSKLPSTLKYLFLDLNHLTKLDVAALPRGLCILSVSQNHLVNLDLIELPPALIKLDAGNNFISSADLTKLPRTLTDLNLVSNHISSVDLSALPPTLQLINLRNNRLSDASLRTIPDGICFV